MIGIIPAAGKAERLYGLPKFLLPVGDTYLLHHHLRLHEMVGLDQIVVATSPVFQSIVRNYTWSSIAVYPVTTATQNETVLTARRFKGQCSALMTMPDSYWQDLTVCKRLADAVRKEKAIVAAALWRVRPDQIGKLGQCFALGGEVVDVMDKDPECPHPYVWGALAWSPSFWGFIQPEDPHPGYALARAIEAGVRPKAVFAEGSYYDLGTFAEYQKLCLDLQGVTA